VTKRDNSSKEEERDQDKKRKALNNKDAPESSAYNLRKTRKNKNWNSNKSSAKKKDKYIIKKLKKELLNPYNCGEMHWRKDCSKKFKNKKKAIAKCIISRAKEASSSRFFDSKNKSTLSD
jgi:hypothetical protein